MRLKAKCLLTESDKATSSPQGKTGFLHFMAPRSTSAHFKKDSSSDAHGSTSVDEASPERKSTCEVVRVEAPAAGMTSMAS